MRKLSPVAGKHIYQQHDYNNWGQFIQSFNIVKSDKKPTLDQYRYYYIRRNAIIDHDVTRVYNRTLTRNPYWTLRRSGRSLSTHSSLNFR